MNLLLIANVVIFFSALIGMFMIAEKNKYGFVVFLLVESSLAYIGAATNNYGLVLTAALYLVMNIYSFIKWSGHNDKRV